MINSPSLFYNWGNFNYSFTSSKGSNDLISYYSWYSGTRYFRLILLSIELLFSSSNFYRFTVYIFFNILLIFLIFTSSTTLSFGLKMFLLESRNVIYFFSFNEISWAGLKISEMFEICFCLPLDNNASAYYSMRYLRSIYFESSGKISASQFLKRLATVLLII